jgi:uncharacterized integral membrane protein (TIGR00697 family)
MNNTTSLTNASRPKPPIFLAMLYVTILLLSGTFFYRFVDIHSILLPGGILIYPLMYVITDIVAELHGYSIAKSFILYGILCNFFFGIMAFILTHTPTVPGSTFTHDYNIIFRSLVKLDFGNCIGSIFGGFLNIYLISKWKILVKGRFFFIRSITSNLFGELAMLVVTGFIVLLWTMPINKIIYLLVADYTVRIIFSICASIPAALYVSYYRHNNDIDTYDISTKFNPFNISIKK